MKELSLTPGGPASVGKQKKLSHNLPRGMTRVCHLRSKKGAKRLVLIRMIREPADREKKDKNRTTHKRTAGKAGSHKGD